MREASPILKICDLSIGFSSREGILPAVSHLSLSLERGSILAIVGESGSGKSVTALAITRLLSSPPAIYQTGQVLFEGTDLLSLPEKKLRSYRGGRIAYIFQEPSTSLHPVYTIRSQMREMLRLHRPELQDLDTEIIHWLDMVGISDPKERLNSYPHELSGGMQQRMMIAMALLAQPDLLIADEPTTALDVTIQAQILVQLRELQKKLGMAVIFITHHLGIIRGLADHVAVMRHGAIVEYGATEELLQHPQHPYTQALLACIPRLEGHRRRLATIEG